MIIYFNIYFKNRLIFITYSIYYIKQIKILLNKMLNIKNCKK